MIQGNSPPSPQAVVAAFETFRDGALRTVGTLFVPPALWANIDHWDSGDAQSLSRMLDPFQGRSDSAARDKLAFLTSSPEGQTRIACFQVKARSAAPIFCGNATAAALSLLANKSGESRIRAKVISADASIEATATFEENEDGVLVHHEWEVGLTPSLFEDVLFDRPAIHLDWLNDYWIVLGPISGPEHDLVAAIGAGASLNSRVAIVDASEDVPQVRFYNPNGLHGAAPHTGLLALALACEAVSWLKDGLSARQISTPSSYEWVPIAVHTEDGVKFGLPDVRVRLNWTQWNL